MLQIYGCTYGDRDVTSFVQAMIQPDQSLTFTVDPSVLGGDPLPNVRKNFVMLGSYTGYPALLIFQDGGQVSLTGGSITANQLFLASGYCFGLDKLGNLSNFNGIEASPVDTGFGSVSFLLGLQMFMIALENTVQDSPIFSMSDPMSDPVQTNGNAASVYSGADGESWAIQASGALLRWSAENNNWESRPGPILTQMAVVSQHLQWGLDNENNIYSRNLATDSWNFLCAGPETAMISSIAAAADGSLYVVDSDGAVFTYTGGDNPWMPYGDPAYKVQSIAITDVNNAWIALQDGSVLFIGGCNPQSVPDTRAYKHNLYWDTESVFDEKQSTHLYIVNRAAQLAATNPQLGAFISQLLQPMLGPPPASGVFRQNMCQGLYDADFLSAYNNPNFIGQPTWKSHFYDDSTGLNYEGEQEPTALTNGLKFFMASVNAMTSGTPDPATAGYNLGLALHYFTDLTQPMHSGNYTYLSSFPFGYHTDFEVYTLKNQALLNPQPTVTGFQPGQVSDPAVMMKNLSVYFKGTYLDKVVSAADYHGWKFFPSTWQNAVAGFLPQVINDAVANTAQFIYLWAYLAKKQGVKIEEVSKEEMV